MTLWEIHIKTILSGTSSSIRTKLPKLCPAVVLSHQDGCHSAVALLLKAALIQVSVYRLLGAFVFIKFSKF
jgi:hypothetical protein